MDEKITEHDARKGYGVPLLREELVPKLAGGNGSEGTECRACRGLNLLYSEDERPAESCRISGNGRMD